MEIKEPDYPLKVICCQVVLHRARYSSHAKTTSQARGDDRFRSSHSRMCYTGIAYKHFDISWDIASPIDREKSSSAIA